MSIVREVYRRVVRVKRTELEKLYEVYKAERWVSVGFKPDGEDKDYVYITFQRPVRRSS